MRTRWRRSEQYPNRAQRTIEKLPANVTNTLANIIAEVYARTMDTKRSSILSNDLLRAIEVPEKVFSREPGLGTAV